MNPKHRKRGKKERPISLLAFLLSLITSSALFFGLVGQVEAADTSPDTTAKYLAGLAVPAAPADGQVDSPWILHSAELDRAWKRFAEQQLPAIANWAPEALGTAYQGRGPMFYMFSGPDFLYAHAFFPQASAYILCGNEPVGNIPELNAIAPQQLPASLANLRKSMESSLNWSFFITKNMKTDLNQPQLNGILPVLYVFLARSGCAIEQVTPVALDRSGNLIEGGKAETSGVKIEFVNSGGGAQTLYYFSSDLSDDGIKSHPAFMNFCERQGEGASLLKAASYLMHERGFEKVREFLLRQSKVIVQDDSGIPLRYFDREKWDLRYYGRYAGPIETFKQHGQPDLVRDFATAAPSPLPFGFGYRWQPSQSNVIVALRKFRAPNDPGGPGGN
jgi:hypothetical protein